MKNNIWFILTCVLAFFAGYNLNDAALSVSGYKVAVVDVAEILSHSAEIQQLKISQEKDNEELNILISKAQNDLLNESDRTKFLQKENDYKKQIELKKSEIDKKYNSKLSVINNNIKNTISAEAKKENYNLVLPAGMVISGGKDITSNIVEKIK